mmetsp:Transcript_29760/g.46711  ORF Transcript_29760/g.46711 Transcript_29760/m.46711 type:complete len:83 (-) Transcript_29760:264-512(-)
MGEGEGGEAEPGHEPGENWHGLENAWQGWHADEPSNQPRPCDHPDESPDTQEHKGSSKHWANPSAPQPLSPPAPNAGAWSGI